MPSSSFQGVTIKYYCSMLITLFLWINTFTTKDRAFALQSYSGQLPTLRSIRHLCKSSRSHWDYHSHMGRSQLSQPTIINMFADSATIISSKEIASVATAVVTSGTAINPTILRSTNGSSSLGKQAVSEFSSFIAQIVDTEAQGSTFRDVIVRMKTMASRRLSLADSDRMQLLNITLPLLSLFDLNQLSDAIWALGTLKCSIRTQHPVAVEAKQRLVSVLQGWSGSLTGSVAHMPRVESFRLLSGLGKLGFAWEEIPPAVRSRFLYMIVDGGVNSDLDNEDTTASTSSSGDYYESDASGEGDVEGDLRVADGPLRGRELAAYVYTLGQLGVTREMLGRESESLLTELLARLTPSILQGINPQGFSNMLHGMARLGVLWADLPVAMQADTVTYLQRLLRDMKHEEFISQLQSLAVMKATWSSLNEGYRRTVLEKLSSEALRERLTARELSNLLWSLGKMSMSLLDEPVAQAAIMKLLDRLSDVMPLMSAFDTESVLVGLGLLKVNFARVPTECRVALVNKVVTLAEDMNIFWLHNTLWGLARMGATAQVDPTAAVSKLDNVSVTESSGRYIGHATSQALLRKIVMVMHSFLPVHYGDLMWAMGSLGYTKAALDAIDIHAINPDHDPKQYPTSSQRVLAILSRIYATLHVRAAAYALWGLAKMGFVWADLKRPSRSIPGGRPAPPLLESLRRFLKQRTASMREHEFAVLLYSLGEMGAEWADLDLPESKSNPNTDTNTNSNSDSEEARDHDPSNNNNNNNNNNSNRGPSSNSVHVTITSKIHHRVTRVSSFLTARSTANAILGMGKCSVRWSSLPEATKKGWLDALLANSGSDIDVTYGASIQSAADLVVSVLPLPSDAPAANTRGLRYMNAAEVSQVVFGLGLMVGPTATRASDSIGATSTLPRALTQMLIKRVSEEMDNMTPQGRSCALWGLVACGVGTKQLPRARELLLTVEKEATQPLSTIELDQDGPSQRLTLWRKVTEMLTAAAIEP